MKPIHRYIYQYRPIRVCTIFVDKKNHNSYDFVYWLNLNRLTIKAPAKKSSENAICLSRLLQFANMYLDPDQIAPKSTLFAKKASNIFQQMTKADDFSCDWRFKVKLLTMHRLASSLFFPCLIAIHLSDVKVTRDHVT